MLALSGVDRGEWLTRWREVNDIIRTYHLVLGQSIGVCLDDVGAILKHKRFGVVELVATAGVRAVVDGKLGLEEATESAKSIRSLNARQ